MYTKGEVAGKGIYEHGQDYVYCNRYRDMDAFSFFFSQNKSVHEYGTEHTRRSVPKIDIQPGRKETIHIRHNHEQDTGNL